MSMKKVMAILLTICMLVSLTACGSSGEKKNNNSGTAATATETPAATETPTTAASASGITQNGVGDIYGGLTALPDAGDPITFTMFVRDPGTVPSKDNPILKKITELTGVTIDFEFLVGDLDSKVGVMIAGEDYPDAIFADGAKFTDAGAFIPLEDKLKSYPNLSAHYSPFSDKMTTTDGHQYIMELYSATKAENAAPTFYDGGVGFFIQKAVLEDAGYPIPKTLDEYFKLIEDYKAKNPTIDGVKTVGFEVLSDGWRDYCLRNPAQHLMGAGNDGDAFVDLNTYTASLYQISDTAKSYYKKLNDEYQKGIIEAETFTESYDQYTSRISSGAVLGFFDQQWNFASAENLLKNDGKYNRTYVAVPIANPGVQDSYLDAPTGTITGINGVGITTKCKDPDRLLKFYDWLLQPSVQNYLQWGDEGTDFTTTSDGGKMLTAERRTINNDTAKKRDLTGDTLWQYTPKLQGLYDDGTPCGPGDSKDEYLASQSEYDQNFLKAYNIQYPAELLSKPAERPAYYPVWGMTIADGSDAKVAQTKLADICRKYYPQLVLSNPNDYDKLWDEFLKEVDSANIQPYLDEVNKQIAKAMGK